MVDRCRPYAPDNENLALDGAELKRVKCLRILGVPSDSELTFETHLRKVVSKSARSLDVVHRAGMLFDCHMYTRIVSMRMFCSA